MNEVATLDTVFVTMNLCDRYTDGLSHRASESVLRTLVEVPKGQKSWL